MITLSGLGKESLNLYNCSKKHQMNKMG